MKRRSKSLFRVLGAAISGAMIIGAANGDTMYRTADSCDIAEIFTRPTRMLSVDAAGLQEIVSTLETTTATTTVTTTTCTSTSCTTTEATSTTTTEPVTEAESEPEEIVEDIPEERYYEYSWDEEYLYFPGMTISWADYYLVCNCVAREAGAHSISEYEKALVAEVIFNRWNNNLQYNPDATLYGVITAPYQFDKSWEYADLDTFSGRVTEKVINAVNWYLAFPEDFDEGYTSFRGNGTYNYFW